MNTKPFLCRNCGDEISFESVKGYLLCHYRREAVMAALAWEREGRRGVPRSIRAWHAKCAKADGKAPARGKVYAELA